MSPAEISVKLVSNKHDCDHRMSPLPMGAPGVATPHKCICRGRGSRMAWLDAHSLMVDSAIWAHRSAYVAICDYKAGRADGEPFFLALLTIPASFLLPVSPPE